MELQARVETLETKLRAVERWNRVLTYFLGFLGMILVSGAWLAREVIEARVRGYPFLLRDANGTERAFLEAGGVTGLQLWSPDHNGKVRLVTTPKSQQLMIEQTNWPSQRAAFIVGGDGPIVTLSTADKGGIQLGVTEEGPHLKLFSPSGDLIQKVP